MTILRPNDLQEKLGSSASALQLWSDKFSPVLALSASKSTTESGTLAQRRYTEDDLQTLLKAKQFLGQSKTYEETLDLLSRDYVPLDKASTHSPRTGQDVAVLDDHPMIQTPS